VTGVIASPDLSGRSNLLIIMGLLRSPAKAGSLAMTTDILDMSLNYAKLNNAKVGFNPDLATLGFHQKVFSKMR
jgi:hypothetical protein